MDNGYKEEKENKKQLIKEVMEGIERKKTLKDFFDDPRSYKQYRDDRENCMIHTDWDKIHRTMKMQTGVILNMQEMILKLCIILTL